MSPRIQREKHCPHCGGVILIVWQNGDYLDDETVTDQHKADCPRNLQPFESHDDHQTHH